ncbi:GNAT family N-acetyltransferase [Candidatus Woesearchaeota archaeon]|nr:GNAT family N-acetyltransferase [Candidatus Woesearchaeota archaeon]
MSNNFVIEKLSAKNFDEFVSLIRRLADYERLEPPNKEAVRRLKNDGLSKNPKYEAYLGKISNNYVTYIMFFMGYSSFLAKPTLFWEDLFVLKDYRGKGIGQSMFNFCIKKAKERKCGRIDGCILDWNKPSIEFFEKNNAKRLNWLYYRINLVN